MGQRLVIQITKVKERAAENLATSYYHWSGYTESALSLTNIVLEELKNKQYFAFINDEFVSFVA